MMSLARSARRRHASGDGGFSMILVMGFMLVVGILVVGALGVATNSLQSSRQHVTFEQALSAGESGIDQGLARLQQAYTTYVADYPIPDKVTTTDPTPLCTDDPANWTAPSGGFASEAAERSWARTKLTALAAAHPECIRKAVSGQYIVLKPSNRQTVYAMGWAPSYANPLKTRLVKAEYIFAPWRPAVAVLTGGNLAIDSSTTINNVDSSLTEGGVHSNGSIAVQGNPTVYGEVSSSGTSTTGSNKFYSNPGGTVINEPPMRLPTISGKFVYLTAMQSGTYTDTDWYDLCPNGTVMKPSLAGPCANTAGDAVEANLASGGTYRGWSFATVSGVPTWTATKDIIGNAVYYVSGGNVTTGNGNPSITSTTIIATAQDNTVCPKVGGNINWDKINIAQPKIDGLFMLAEADLATGPNFSAGSTSATGQFVAGDQVNMQTSSNGAYGSVVATDQCPASSGEVNEIKNPAITFAPNVDSPFSSIINTTLWLEYVGS
jgi:Tfp pilus assembly protein PilV